METMRVTTEDPFEWVAAQRAPWLTVYLEAIA